MDTQDPITPMAQTAVEGMGYLRHNTAKEMEYTSNKNFRACW